MKPMQQRFWPDAQPLVERLGRGFFRQLPDRPGVYRMLNSTDAVLYIGKAKNLRHRLCSYRVANPERMARRTLRLLNLVNRIVWEECGDEAAALRREADLLLQIKPRFNRAGVWPGPARFLSWRCSAAALELRVVENVEACWLNAGSFGAQAAHLHRALVRLIWCALCPEDGLAAMPAGWFRGRHGRHVLIPHRDRKRGPEACERLAALAAGDSDSFVRWLHPSSFSFEQTMREEDLQLVTRHFPGRFIRHNPAQCVCATQSIDLNSSPCHDLL
jgi:predicted GIY-YIG superfamily endonuclease